MASQQSRAIIVCVDYSDYLEITLPYNKHHFDEMLIVSTPDDISTHSVCEANGIPFFTTNSFYEDKAFFNKWKALEEGLDVLGRDSWITILDADILIPKHIDYTFEFGNLYTPWRRMCENLSMGVPKEPYWLSFPRHKFKREFSGYYMRFHGSDYHLPNPPWHETNWMHAGGGDMLFAQHWSEAKKIRPNFEVLHLGQAGVNWCGRSTKRLDGSTPKDAEQRKAELDRFLKLRKKEKKRTYANEKTTR